ncbi:MAG TPA: hypothetical protein VNO31_22215 [Umezawaea sp.]|nr:hypothetical protein [Umezawaea sp.]
MIRRAAAALLLVSAVAGCGVTPTEPFSYGDPPTVQQVDGVRVYFVLNSRLFDVLRTGSQDLSPAERLDLLFAGPTVAERAAGVVTELPEGYRIATPPVGVHENRIVVDVVDDDGVDLGRFSDLAGRQLACSATPRRVARDVGIVVRAPDGAERGPFRCE